MPRPSAKSKLMVAAMSSFKAQGFRACTIEDIATKAGVFKGSFYNHFKSKEALAVEAVKAYTAAAIGAIPPQGPPSPLKRLQAHFEILVDIQRKSGCRDGCLLANFSAEISDSNADLRAALVEGVDQWCGAIAKVIRQAQACGEITKRFKADFLARALGNAWEGATIRSKATRSSKPLDEFMTMYFGGLLN